jgi:G3E family GTPase
MLVGYQRRKPFGFSDQFLAYQCQANRYVAVIKYVSDTLKRQDETYSYDYMISEINRAYLRCTLTGNLKSAVRDILKTYQSDFIILEDSGKSDLAGLMKEVIALGDLIRFDSVTTVIDSFTGEKTIEISEEVQKQVLFADIILLDKKELLDEIRMQNLIRIIRELNPRAPIISVKSRTFDPSLVYGINLMNFNQSIISESTSVMDNNGESDVCDHLCAIRCPIEQPVNKNQFFKRIEEVPEKVFRIEGLLKFTDERFPVHLQYVGGRYDIRNYPNPMFKDQFVVIVSKEIGGLSLQF